MSVTEAPAVQERVLYRTNWAGYMKLHEIIGEQPIRVNYDAGTLEIMTISHRHERIKTLINDLVKTAAAELGFGILSGGSMTFQRQDLDKGMEPDQCYWIAGARKMLGKTDFDWHVDPPPDLVVEIDISSSSLDRISMFAAVGVPEVWRFRKTGELDVLKLNAAGRYEAGATSAAMPGAPVEEVAAVLADSDRLLDNEVVDAFRARVRARSAKKP